MCLYTIEGSYYRIFLQLYIRVHTYNDIYTLVLMYLSTFGEKKIINRIIKLRS